MKALKVSEHYTMEVSGHYFVDKSLYSMIFIIFLSVLIMFKKYFMISVHQHFHYLMGFFSVQSVFYICIIILVHTLYIYVVSPCGDMYIQKTEWQSLFITPENMNGNLKIQECPLSENVLCIHIAFFQRPLHNDNK